jgi:HEAT repeat protein
MADANPSVRCAAVRAVAHLSAARSMEILIQALGDEAAIVRDSAAAALAGMGRTAVDAIIGALGTQGLEDGALRALMQLPVRPPAKAMVEYARTKVSLGLQYAAWRRAVAILAPASEPLGLLCESLGAAARAQAMRAIEAIGVLDETGATALVLQGPTRWK